jgi:acyl carrier protein
MGKGSAEEERAAGDCSAVSSFDEFAALLQEQLFSAYPHELHRDTRLFDDVGIDSLEVFHIVVFVEELAGSEIGDLASGEPPSIVTVLDAYDLYRVARSSIESPRLAT